MTDYNEIPDCESARAPVRIAQWMIDEAARFDPIFREFACKGVNKGVFRLE